MVDLFGENGCLDAVEVLVVLRNTVVLQVNKAKGLSRLGTYLWAFDALYTIWRGQQKIEDSLAIPLVPTVRGKAVRSAAKLAVTLASLGTVHYMGSVADAAGLLRDLAWPGESAIDITREKFIERVFEKHVFDINHFLHRFVAPHASSTLRAAIGDKKLDSNSICMLMFDILLKAIARIQADLHATGQLMLLIDAIDVLQHTEDEDREFDYQKDNSKKVRFALSGLMISLRRQLVASVLSGRDNASLWLEEFYGQPPRTVPLDDIPARDIRTTFSLEGIDDETIEQILVAAGSPARITAGALSEACSHLSITWPARSDYRTGVR